jgi:glucosamine-phosphate N-acetyltransferase
VLGAIDSDYLRSLDFPHSAQTPVYRTILLRLTGTNMRIRQMVAPDLKNGFLEALSALSEVNLTFEEAVPVFQRRLNSGLHTYVAEIDGEIVGTAAVFIEQKFLHSGGLVGHIEDVAVDSQRHGQGIGRELVQYLIQHCRDLGCYKILLQCTPELMPFYEREGFHQWVMNMRMDLAPVTISISSR